MQKSVSDEMQNFTVGCHRNPQEAGATIIKIKPNHSQHVFVMFSPPAKRLEGDVRMEYHTCDNNW